VREAVPAELPQIAAVALSIGQDSTPDVSGERGKVTTAR
jgi:hypothetical protein